MKELRAQNKPHPGKNDGEAPLPMAPHCSPQAVEWGSFLWGFHSRESLLPYLWPTGVPEGKFPSLCWIKGWLQQNQAPKQVTILSASKSSPNPINPFSSPALCFACWSLSFFIWKQGQKCLLLRFVLELQGWNKACNLDALFVWDVALGWTAVWTRKG